MCARNNSRKNEKRRETSKIHSFKLSSRNKQNEHVYEEKFKGKNEHARKRKISLVENENEQIKKTHK